MGWPPVARAPQGQEECCDGKSPAKRQGLGWVSSVFRDVFNALVIVPHEGPVLALHVPPVTPVLKLGPQDGHPCPVEGDHSRVKAEAHRNGKKGKGKCFGFHVTFHVGRVYARLSGSPSPHDAASTVCLATACTASKGHWHQIRPGRKGGPSTTGQGIARVFP